jgi:Tol biopolymer transport system component
MHRFVLMAIAVAMMWGVARGQLRVLRAEQLVPGDTHVWHAPQFAPDGGSIFLTTPGYQGIWTYSLTTGRLVQLTGDRGAGYGFAVSPDGRSLAYRRTDFPGGGPERVQETVVLNLQDGSSRTLGKGGDLSTPSFSGEAILFTRDGETLESLPDMDARSVTLLGIENTKIALVVGGEKRLLDPLGGGSYLWPALSPDRTRLVACDIARGAFICDLAGNVTARLGRRNAPAWTRDGRWIVYMHDQDDGMKVISSELMAVSVDGSRTVALTTTPGVMEMYPHCSPVEDKIVCSTPDGAVYVLEYGEERE